MRQISFQTNSALIGIAHVYVCIDVGIGILDSHLSDRCEEEKESIGMMREACKFMSNTLNDVLAMQRIEEGLVQLVYQPFSVSDFVISVTESLKVQVMEKSTRIRIEIGTDVPLYLMGDKFQLSHVLANVLSNAIKFSPPCSNVTVRVFLDSEEPRQRMLPIYASNEPGTKHVSHHGESKGQDARQLYRTNSVSRPERADTNGSDTARPHPHSTPFKPFTLSRGGDRKVPICISVTDNGPGIAPEHLSKIFTPFGTTRPGELQPGRGSGVGLAICKRLVNLHGGDINCFSVPGEGCTFTITIPFDAMKDDYGSHQGNATRENTARMAALQESYSSCHDKNLGGYPCCDVRLSAAGPPSQGVRRSIVDSVPKCAWGTGERESVAQLEVQTSAMNVSRFDSQLSLHKIRYESVKERTATDESKSKSVQCDMAPAPDSESPDSDMPTPSCLIVDGIE